MSMPNYEEPDYNPNEPFGAQFSFEDIVSDLTTPKKELLDTIHFYHNGAAESDESAQDTLVQKLGHRALAGNMSRFTWRDVNLDIMPTEYLEAEWQPRPQTLASVSIDKIMVRTPVLQGTEWGVFGEGELVARDVCFEIRYRNGEKHLYYVNDHTPEDRAVAYDSGRQMVFNGSEVGNPDAESLTPNVLELTSLSSTTPDMQLSLLQAIVLEDSGMNSRPQPENG
jgi:hypothetical protein